MDFLLTYYEQLADAPDAISRLRDLVLDLALRGKLLAQDSSDQPASTLLEIIMAERACVAQTGEIRPVTPEPAIRNDGLPVATLPASWQLARLAAISRRIHYGFTASADYTLERTRLLRITDIQDNGVDWSSVPGCAINNDDVEKYKLQRGDILIARTGGTIGKTFLVRDVPVTAVFASYLIRVQVSQHLNSEFIKIFFESPTYWVQLHKGSRGTGQPNVNGQALGNLMVPLPPVNEQRRIVSKVNELMTLCDDLEAKRAKREACRDRFSSATIARLNAPDAAPTTFAEHAHFAIRSLNVLTARPDQVKQVREAILNLAVHGKLVPQDPEDEPASKILKHIAEEKGKTREQTDLLLAVRAGDLPLLIPPGWEMARLATISNRIHYGFTASADKNVTTIRMLRITDIQDNTVDWLSVPGCIIEDNQVDQYKLKRGDILIARTGGTIGKTFLVREMPVVAVFASYLIRVQGTAHVFDEYLKLFLESPLYWIQLYQGARGTGQPNVNGQTLGKLIVPLPPLAEQHRIVNKVDELMAVCNRLEASLAAVDEVRCQLLNSVIATSLSSSQVA